MKTKRIGGGGRASPASPPGFAPEPSHVFAVDKQFLFPEYWNQRIARNFDNN